MIPAVITPDWSPLKWRLFDRTNDDLDCRPLCNCCYKGSFYSTRTELRAGAGRRDDGPERGPASARMPDSPCGSSPALARLRLLDIQHESAADSDDAISRYRPYALILNGFRECEVKDHTARRPGAQAAEAGVE